MDSDRRSSGELIIDEDVITSPRNEVSGSPRKRGKRSIIAPEPADNKHVELVTSPQSAKKTKKVKGKMSPLAKRTPASKRSIAEVRKTDSASVAGNKRASNTRVTKQLTKKLHYFKITLLKDLKTCSLSVCSFLFNFILHIFYEKSLFLINFVFIFNRFQQNCNNFTI